MKKIFFALAVLVNIGILSFAQINEPTYTYKNIVSDTVFNSYKVVELDDLSEQVQAIITGYRSRYIIKFLEYDEDKKETRVTLEDQDTKCEKVIKLDYKGEEIN